MPTAMVIDDSKTVRAILTRSLNTLGFDVFTAGNGKEALAILDRDLPEVDCFLVDWNMPEMNGLDFVKSLRARPSCADVPLMMVTTETEIDQMIRALDAGANEYVMKPFTDEMIADKLRLMGVLD